MKQHDATWPTFPHIWHTIRATPVGPAGVVGLGACGGVVGEVNVGTDVSTAIFGALFRTQELSIDVTHRERVHDRTSTNTIGKAS